MTRFAKNIVLLIIIAAIGWFLYGRFFGHSMGGMDHGMGGGGAPVSVAEVIERNVQQWHEYSGRLVAVNQVEVRPRVSGTIESVNFSNGMPVKKGDLLFVIDPRPYEAALESATARAGFAESEFKRAETLLGDKAIPQREYDQRRSAASVAKADLITARLNLEYTHVKSPISGRVGRAEITLGNLVQSGPNAPVLTTIVAYNPIYADFEVDEESFLRYVASDANGSRASEIPVLIGLASEEGAPHEGYIESFDNRLNNESGTIRVRAIVDNPKSSLVPGLFVRVRLGSVQEARAILITDRAVGTDQSKKFVYVIGDDNKVQYREVKLGAMAEGLRIVHEGLQPGEKIIVNGLQRARPGAPITPEMVPMDPKDAAVVPPKAEGTVPPKPEGDAPPKAETNVPPAADAVEPSKAEAKDPFIAEPKTEVKEEPKPEKQ
jgi:multidrug efflux system membrane fusion protein